MGIRKLSPASILKRLVLLPRSFNLIFARSRETGSSGIRISYLGEGESFAYIQDMLAAGDFELVSRAFPLWGILKIVRQSRESREWLCVEINRLLLPFLPRQRFLTFPWLRQRIFLDSAEYRRRRRKIEDGFGRKVRKYGYSFRFVHDAGSVKCFYERLYLPHIKARFGNECHARTLPELLKAVQKGFLLQVWRGDLWIAGVVCGISRNEISARAFGHLPEAEYSLRLGAMSAAYYGLLGYAGRNSFSCVDLIRSRPDTRDGVYGHKRRWGAIPHIDNWPHTAILLFPPQRMPVPEPFESLLLWDGQAFREMGKI